MTEMEPSSQMRLEKRTHVVSTEQEHRLDSLSPKGFIQEKEKVLQQPENSADQRGHVHILPCAKMADTYI